jgi:Rod binding domain-containing protein
MYMQMLPDQLADAVTSAGGLGLAKNFYDTIKERS